MKLSVIKSVKYSLRARADKTSPGQKRGPAESRDRISPRTAAAKREEINDGGLGPFVLFHGKSWFEDFLFFLFLVGVVSQNACEKMTTS